MTCDPPSPAGVLVSSFEGKAMNKWVDDASDPRVTGARPNRFVCCSCMKPLTVPFWEGDTVWSVYCRPCAEQGKATAPYALAAAQAVQAARPEGAADTDSLEKRVYDFFTKPADPAYCCGGACLRSQCDYHRDAPKVAGNKWVFAHDPEVLHRIEAQYGRAYQEIGPNRFVVDGSDVWSWRPGWYYEGPV